MSKSSKFFRSVLRGLKNFATKNLGIKIVAIVFALMLWGYIMADVNPVQPKQVNDVKISLEGTNDLMSRHLIVVEEMSGTANVTVASNINNHNRLDASRINCTASVATITAPGTYQLPLEVTVQNDLGTVQSVSPATITVEIDRLISKTVPVRVDLEGEMDEGYEIVSRNVANAISIEGAARYIEPVSRAVATIPIGGLTSDYEGAVDVVFFDKNDEVIDVVTRTGETPSVVVQMDISAVRYDVPIQLMLSEYDSKYLDVVTSMSFDTIDLFGDPAALEQITAVLTEEIPVTEDMIGTSSTAPYTLVLPEGITVRTGQQKTVRVTIEVKDAEVEQEFEVKVDYIGKDKDLELAQDAPNIITILVKGKIKDIEKTLSTDFTATADLTGLVAGRHEILVTTVYNGKLDLVIVEDAEKISLTLNRVIR